MSGVYGAFVFLFLFVFEPFGLSEVRGSLLWYCLGAGLTTWVVIGSLNVGAAWVFKGAFSEERWTVGKEILWTVLVVGLLGVINAGYSYVMGVTGFGWGMVWRFELYTLAVGFFPIVGSVLLRQSRLQRVHAAQSLQMESLLPDYVPAPVSMGLVLLPNGKESAGVEPVSVLYLQGADNYVELHRLLPQGGQEKVLLRTTLAQVEAAFAGYPEIIRCHKSYVVNLKQVVRISGNAQGCRLHLKRGEMSVPVSRNLIESVRSRLTLHS